MADTCGYNHVLGKVVADLLYMGTVYTQRHRHASSREPLSGSFHTYTSELCLSATYIHTTMRARLDAFRSTGSYKLKLSYFQQ
eukprot:9469947-Pyramimonas_sp.AAC.1